MAVLSRRLALAFGMTMAVAHSRAQDASQADAFIQQTGRELASLMSCVTSDSAKRERLMPFIDRVVDVDAVGRFCLGRYWAVATPEQRAVRNKHPASFEISPPFLVIEFSIEVHIHTIIADRIRQHTRSASGGRW